jgi:hypothetical protein
MEEEVLDLDFHRGRMTLSPAGVTSAEQDLIPVIAECKPLAGDFARLIIIEGAFENSGPLYLMLNSGSWETEIDQSVSRCFKPSIYQRGRGLSGTVLRGGICRGRLLVNGARLPDTQTIVTPQIPPLGGQIGMEILQFTRLQLYKPNRHVRWWVPQEWLTAIGARGSE